jgi:RNA polymerase sigma-70 factor (ECF subfamily)
MSEAEDALFVKRTLEGERKAFESIVDKYYKIIYNVALRMGIDCDDAYDITQTVFIKAFENLSSYKVKYKFFSWLYRITVNESLNFLHHQNAHEYVEADNLPASETPEHEYGRIEVAEVIQKSIMELKVDYRVVIVLNHFHNLSYNEIGYVLDLPEKTVKSRLFTARQMLKDILIRRRGIE